MNEEETSELISQGEASDYIQFKENKIRDHEFEPGDYIGSIISGLSNSAKIKKTPFAYIFWGIQDSGNVYGTNFEPKNTKAAGNEDLLFYLKRTLPTVNFDFLESVYKGNRLVICKIRAVKDFPTVYKNKILVFVEGSLQNATKYPLLNARLFEIQNLTDWSAEMCEDITVEDFDESAVNLFVSDYKKNHIQNQNISDIQIFEKLGILIDGKVTNSGALLLCKEEFANKVSFGQYARIQCIYDYSKIKDLSNPETGKRDRENYTIPLYPKIFKTIEFINRHNEPIAQTNIFRDGERQYDEILLRELILNAITHRDWSVCEPSPYIQILQNPDGITISNVGEYKFKDLLTLATLPNINKFYRNPLLSNLFRMIGLVDQEGGGIIDKIIPSQKKKGFPLPIYTKKDGLTVAKIEVKILDLKFAELIQNVDMEIRDLVLLDKIARGKNKLAVDIEREDFKKLKSKGYVVAGKGKHPVIEINTKFAEQNNITGYKLKFQKYNKGKEEEIILNLLKQHEKRKMSEFEQLFEDRHYTLDMVYNIIRRLKLKKLVTRDTKNLWSLTSDLTTINLLNEKII